MSWSGVRPQRPVAIAVEKLPPTNRIGIQAGLENDTGSFEVTMGFAAC